MTFARFSLLFAAAFLLSNCTEKKPVVDTPYQAEYLPGNVQRTEARVFGLNAWVENDRFYVTGLCNNPTSEWHKFWIEAMPFDAAGKPLSIAGHRTAIIPTFSDAVAPSGRSSFFISWPLSDFSGTPANCQIMTAYVSPRESGPILAVPMLNSLKMMGPLEPGSTISVEKAWYVSGSISNPLDLVASKVRLEIVLYGTDNKIWLCTLLNPDDPAVKSIFKYEREGPFQPKEERPFNLQLSYEGLPKPLQDLKISRLDILPFEAR